MPTPDIPMAFSKSVVATDGYIYVGDMVNARLIRLKKTFYDTVQQPIAP